MANADKLRDNRKKVVYEALDQTEKKPQKFSADYFDSQVNLDKINEMA